MIKNIKTNSDRDIILSPNRTARQPGKIMFYHPNDILQLTPTSSSSTVTKVTTQVPWEEALKYTMSVVLQDKEEYKQFGLSIFGCLSYLTN